MAMSACWLAFLRCSGALAVRTGRRATVAVQWLMLLGALFKLLRNCVGSFAGPGGGLHPDEGQGC